MSVILYEYKEFEGVYNELVKIPELEKVVMNNDYVKRYNSQQMPISMKRKYEDVLGRLMWYMYVANRVAFMLQYQKDEKIFTPEQSPEKYTLDEAKQKFGSFMYNIYTNDGNVFLSEDWLGLAEDVKKFIYPKDFAKGGKMDEVGNPTDPKVLAEMEKFIKEEKPKLDKDRFFTDAMRRKEAKRKFYKKYSYGAYNPRFSIFAEGGTLPQPFGQAGLVGETGTMNEVDLFAMGGDLPQGVHQFYANTYNPAYPTPHGYAKGGKIDTAYIDELRMGTGMSKNAIEELVERNNFSQENLLNIIVGLGRGFITPSLISSAFFGGKSSPENKKLVEFSKSNKAFKYAEGGIVNNHDEIHLLRTAIGFAIREANYDKEDRKKLTEIFNRLYSSRFDFAKGGKTQGKIYIIQEKSKYDIGVPKWKDEKFLTGGKKYLSYKDAQEDKKKLQRMSSSTQYKVVEWTPKLGFAKGGKLYYQQDGIGKAKYTVSYYDGKKTHKDGSPFYDIAIFKNKKDLKSFIEKLESEGYKKKFAKGGDVKELRKISKELAKSVKSHDRQSKELKKIASSLVEEGMMAKGGEMSKLKRGHRVRVVNTQYDGKEGLIVAGETNGKYSVQLEDGKVKGIERENLMLLDRRQFAKGGKTQGYNDKLDESLGNTKGKRSTKEQNYKDRRDESEAMERKDGRRKYARVKTMDKNRRKRKTPMSLAKEIRKDGEKWIDAVKRASAMIKKK